MQVQLSIQLCFSVVLVLFANLERLLNDVGLRIGPNGVFTRSGKRLAIHVYFEYIC